MKTYTPIYIQRNNNNEKIVGLVFLLVIALVLVCAGVASAQSINSPESVHKATVTIQPGASNNSATINWSIAADSKYPFFLIERTIDKVHYEIVSVVKNTDTGNSTNYYTARDYNPSNQPTCYKVSYLDDKGKPARQLFEVVCNQQTTQVGTR
jgi:hypothetical protein